jgi:3-dehydroquinate dehydratase-1
MLYNKILVNNQLSYCIPVSESNEKELIIAFEEALKSQPDILEWRRDGFTENQKDMSDVMQKIKDITKDIPLIYTFRHQSEGGFQETDDYARINDVQQALDLGLADLLDVEQKSDSEFLKKIKKLCNTHHAKLILSFHDFDKSYETDRIISILEKGYELGADVSKIALMPNSTMDVKNIVTAVNYVGHRHKMPVIGIAMGELGQITRIIPDYFQSCLTFAVGKKASAPGQLTISEIEEKRKIFLNIK